MKEYFDTQIKPLNNDLGIKLGNKIDVTHQTAAHRIPVSVWVKNSETTRIKLTVDKLRTYRYELGLNI